MYSNLPISGIIGSNKASTNVRLLRIPQIPVDLSSGREREGML